MAWKCSCHLRCILCELSEVCLYPLREGYRNDIMVYLRVHVVCESLFGVEYSDKQVQICAGIKIKQNCGVELVKKKTASLNEKERSNDNLKKHNV